jgi:chemotaxis protein CheD
METLVNEVLKHGGVRRNLKAKVFGGAHMLRGVKDMGRQNIDFVHQYLYDEGIRLVTEDVGGTRGRKIEFFPSTGRVRLKLLKEVERVPLVERESLYLKEISSQSVGGDIELF